MWCIGIGLAALVPITLGGNMVQDARDQSHEPTPKGRRRFLSMAGRNLLAVGAIATTAIVESKRAQAVCFLKGTRIRTATGERKVEDLAVGDLVPTAFGGLRPIQWVGTYRFKRSDRGKPWPIGLRPIRIARSALAPNVPHTDLFVTQFHAVLIDGALARVRYLINGRTITRCAADELDVLEYFHVKLATHDVIEAEGAPCETLLQVDESASNFADYYRRYGMPQEIERPCVPMLRFNGSLGEVKSRMLSALSPLVDRRRKLDIIRDHLEERALAQREDVDALS